MPIKYEQQAFDEWPIAIPTYTPPQYWYCDLEYDQLPSRAQWFLHELLPYANKERSELDLMLRAKRKQLATGLSSSLRENDKALVKLRHQARRLYVELSSSGSATSEGKGRRSTRYNKVPVQRVLEERQDGRSYRDVLEALLRDRKLLFDDFMTMFDAVMWWEMRSVHTLMDMAHQQKTRNACCQPIIDGTHSKLRALDRTAMDSQGVWLKDQEMGNVEMRDNRSVGSSTEDGNSSGDESNCRRIVEEPRSPAAVRPSKPISMRTRAMRTTRQGA